MIRKGARWLAGSHGVRVVRAVEAELLDEVEAEAEHRHFGCLSFCVHRARGGFSLAKLTPDFKSSSRTTPSTRSQRPAERTAQRSKAAQVPEKKPTVDCAFGGETRRAPPPCVPGWLAHSWNATSEAEAANPLNLDEFEKGPERRAKLRHKSRAHESDWQ